MTDDIPRWLFTLYAHHRNSPLPGFRGWEDGHDYSYSGRPDFARHYGRENMVGGFRS